MPLDNTLLDNSLLAMATADKANVNDVKALPAHQTKHLPLIVYPVCDNIKFELAQSDDGANNGTALWLGAQILSAFLTDALPTPRIYSVGQLLVDHIVYSGSELLLFFSLCLFVHGYVTSLGPLGAAAARR